MTLLRSGAAAGLPHLLRGGVPRRRGLAGRGRAAPASVRVLESTAGHATRAEAMGSVSRRSRRSPRSVAAVGRRGRVECDPIQVGERSQICQRNRGSRRIAAGDRCRSAGASGRLTRVPSKRIRRASAAVRRRHRAPSSPCWSAADPSTSISSPRPSPSAATPAPGACHAATPTATATTAAATTSDRHDSSARRPRRRLPLPLRRPPRQPRARPRRRPRHRGNARRRRGGLRNSGSSGDERRARAPPTRGGRTTRATVTIARRPLWRIRLARGLPRYVLYALALAGALASARFALDPPRAALPAALLRRPAGEDLAAEGFATLFARAYLTWEAQHPEAREHALAPFVGSGIDAGAGLQPPASGEQRVQWTQVVQEREPQPGDHVYTVAAANRHGRAALPHRQRPPQARGPARAGGLPRVRRASRLRPRAKPTPTGACAK